MYSSPFEVNSMTCPKAAKYGPMSTVMNTMQTPLSTLLRGPGNTPIMIQ